MQAGPRQGRQECLPHLANDAVAAAALGGVELLVGLLIVTAIVACLVAKGASATVARRRSATSKASSNGGENTGGFAAWEVGTQLICRRWQPNFWGRFLIAPEFDCESKSDLRQGRAKDDFQG